MRTITPGSPGAPAPSSPGAPLSPTAPATPSETTLDSVLRAVNRLRADLGGDPIYELPCGTPSFDGNGCVLEHAFCDLGVVGVDYRYLVGRDFRIEHGLGGFVKRFDRGGYPELLARP